MLRVLMYVRIKERKLGSINDLPVYKFLKEPLIRRFGQEWYDELELCVGELKKQGMIK